MSFQRRLAAVLAADVVGYSRLMGLDEEGTHERLKEHLNELARPKMAEHGGRLIKSTGDGVLVEFPSVLEAMRCAVAVQRGMVERNADVAEDRRLAFRIGINVSDIIIEPEDIYGDGVNIAARLEALAEPNGICISRAVYEQVRDRLPYAFRDMGEQKVKNIARPLHVMALTAAAITALPAVGPIFAPTRSKPWPVPVSATAPSATPLVAANEGAPRLSIVVLPFSDLSDNRDQQYFADAVTEDLTTDLSRIHNMQVISRNTAFTYRGKALDTRRIGQELNIRYVLEGSVQRAGRRLRVNAQLIDAVADAHLWAERFDLEIEDLFALQDEVTSRIAVALHVELISAEAAKPTMRTDALEYILRGRAAWHQGQTPEIAARAVALFEQALQLDPKSSDAQGLLAGMLATRVLDQMTPTAVADLNRAASLVAEALAEAPRSPLARFAMAQLLRARNEFDAAVPEYEATIAVNRNSVLALGALGHCKFLTGAIEESVPAQEQAIRLSPRDPYIASWYWRIGMVHLLQARTEDAVRWLDRARTANPMHAGPHGWLAAAFALQGKAKQATRELSEARRLSGDGRYSSLRAFEEAQSLGARNRDLVERTFYTGLRWAGVPEH